MNLDAWGMPDVRPCGVPALRGDGTLVGWFRVPAVRTNAGLLLRYHFAVEADRDAAERAGLAIVPRCAQLHLNLSERYTPPQRVLVGGSDSSLSYSVEVEIPEERRAYFDVEGLNLELLRRVPAFVAA